MGNYEYAQFEKLCAEKKVTAYKVAKETGITTATLSNWKKGRYCPKYDKLKRIADYFGVPVDYFDPRAITPGGDFKGLIDAMVDGLDYYVPVNDTIKVIVQTVSKWRPEQQKRLLKQIEQVDAIIGENL